MGTDLHLYLHAGGTSRIVMFEHRADRGVLAGIRREVGQLWSRGGREACQHDVDVVAYKHKCKYTAQEPGRA